nr:hypothetical protein [Tanacetum cinerariifolium]
MGVKDSAMWVCEQVHMGRSGEGCGYYLEDTTKLRSTGIFNSAYDDDMDIFTSPVQSMGVEVEFNNIESSTIISPIPIHRLHKDHPKDQILKDPKSAVQTREVAKKSSVAHAFMEPKKVVQALDDKIWVETMQEELLNKKDKRGIVVRNKVRLVAQGHRQEVRIDYDEVFAHVPRIEATRIFLAFASFMRFIVYQMDVKSAFLYGIIEEEVYVSKPSGFIDPHFLNKMSSMGELTFFLGLHVKQSEKGFFISQDKYVAEILKKFDFSSVKIASTPIKTQKPLVKDEEAVDVDVHLYRSMIGSLMYLTASRPDIMFVVCACSRFQVTPKLSHLYVVKRIFRYLKGHEFEVLLMEHDILSFIRDLGHSGDIIYLTDEDFLFQIENKEAKKNNKMSYPRFTKIIIDYFMSKDQSISRRNKMFWHTARDYTMFTSMRYISRHEDTQVHDKSDGNDDDDGGIDDHDDDSEDKRMESDRDEIHDPNLTNVDQTEHEEDVDERVHTPLKYELTNDEKIYDEENIDDEERMDEEEDDEVTMELYKDVNVNLGNEDTEMTNVDQGGSGHQNVSQESGFEQEKEDAHVTLTLVLDTQKADEPVQSSSVSSDFTSKLLNIENPSPTDNEIASLMETSARHTTAVPKITSSFTTTNPLPPPFFNPLLQQATPTPTPTPTPTLTPTTSEATTLFPSLSNFSYIEETIDADEDITLVVVETQEEVADIDAELQGRITQEDVSATTKDANAAEPIVLDDEEVTMTMAQTLIKMKAEKAKLLDEQIATRVHDEEVKQATAREKQANDDLERAQVLQQQYDDKEENID